MVLGVVAVAGIGSVDAHDAVMTLFATQTTTFTTVLTAEIDTHAFVLAAVVGLGGLGRHQLRREGEIRQRVVQRLQVRQVGLRGRLGTRAQQIFRLVARHLHTGVVAAHGTLGRQLRTRSQRSVLHGRHRSRRHRGRLQRLLQKHLHERIQRFEVIVAIAVAVCVRLVVLLALLPTDLVRRATILRTAQETAVMIATVEVGRHLSNVVVAVVVAVAAAVELIDRTVQRSRRRGRVVLLLMLRRHLSLVGGAAHARLTARTMVLDVARRRQHAQRVLVAVEHRRTMQTIGSCLRLLETPRQAEHREERLVVEETQHVGLLQVDEGAGEEAADGRDFLDVGCARGDVRSRRLGRVGGQERRSREALVLGGQQIAPLHHHVVHRARGSTAGYIDDGRSLC